MIANLVEFSFLALWYAEPGQRRAAWDEVAALWRLLWQRIHKQ